MLSLIGLLAIGALGEMVLGAADDGNKTACNKPADVIFVVDGSTSIWPPNFQKQLEFVASVIQELHTAPKMVRFGLIVYGDDVKMEFGLKTFSNTEWPMKAAMAVKQRRGVGATDLALNKMRQMMQEDKREGVRHVAIVTTDDDSRNPEKTRSEAEAAHKEGITVIAVGVGHNIQDKELRSIASNEDFMFAVEDFDELKTVQINFSCDG